MKFVSPPSREGSGAKDLPLALRLRSLRPHVVYFIEQIGGFVMSDVFVSYAREDRSLAQALAEDLENRGCRVWWDAQLVGSDDFQEVILAALARARAAVVICRSGDME